MQDVYFSALQQQLRQRANGQPLLLLDLNRLESNLLAIRHACPNHLTPRLVVKSLANLSLLEYIATRLNTSAFMLFHLAHLKNLIEQFPQADILLGKPMTSQAFECYLKNGAEGSAQIQWLIDSVPRLEQYLFLAQQYKRRIRINLEIDVGLHRGGFSNLNTFEEALQLIRQHAQYLQLGGLMGYDAHIAKLPTVLFKPHKIYQYSQQRYQIFLDALLRIYPEVRLSQLTLNGAGSCSLKHHFSRTVCNDVSLGSMLLKPTDFDLQGLEHLQPALWIATPILKVMDSIRLPGLDKLNRLQLKQKGICVYGGYWRGEYVYPFGLKPHLLYGRSSNQEVLQADKSADLVVDDYVFFRPAQSESILPQFATLHAFQHKQWLKWDNLRE
jgi:D-serine deaminase-like pyridoxal phosphate-dependent protein